MPSGGGGAGGPGGPDRHRHLFVRPGALRAGAIVFCRDFCFTAVSVFMPKGKVRVGTSGWYYDHWRERFYPEDLPKDQLLSYFSERLDTVELNNSFYHLPTEAAFKSWKDKTPGDFLFAIKLSRYITHQKRLKESRESLDFFVERAKLLGKKFGPILVQLPPFLKRDDDRLLSFLKILPKRKRFTFEFRHETWFTDEIYALLNKYDASLCLYELKGVSIEDVTTAKWVYIRLHGPEKTAYTGSYSDEQLQAWADRIGRWSKEGKDVYCYFDNDEKAYAVGDALRLRKMLS
jgi:uncharacterized protein YecE (DUF72 family)